MPLTDQSALPELVSSLPNPHIMKFMLRKKPPPAAAQPRIVYRPAESESVVKYPKDVTGTVLLKHMNMRMAKGDDEVVRPPAIDIYGRLKSDITYNKETIYERSYY